MRTLLRVFLAAAVADASAAQLALDAWHADGQTWLVWTDDQTFTAAESWSIYKSASPIVDVATAELVAQTYPQDARGARLGNAAAGATWTVPDGAGGTYALASDEALFVYTPRAATPEYFAVVKTGNVTVTDANRTGPVAQTLDPVRPHVQVTGTDGGHPFTLYSVWTDGDVDEAAGRPDFPVFGPASFRGQARLFCVFEPTGGLPPAPMPAVVFLHGGGGNYWNFRPSSSAGHLMDLHLEDGLYVTFDDRTYARTPSTSTDSVLTVLSKWFGFCRSFDRFDPMDVVPADDEIVVDYTQRWIDFALDWLILNRDVDDDRVAFMGLSAGGRGTWLYARARPERVSAATAFVMPITPGIGGSGPALWGTGAQDLETTVGGGLTMTQILDPAQPIAPADVPFTRFVDGTNDPLVSWDTKPPVYDALDANRFGAAICWDEREHTNNNNGWAGGHFVGSPRHAVDWLVRYRRDLSFPAFHGVDHAPGVPGTQPDPGDAVVPANGDAWGRFGGWFDWVPDSVEDRPRRWSVALGLVTGAGFAADNAPLPIATASVTIRRAQRFQPPAGAELSWTLLRASDGSQLASGRTTVDPDGLVTLSGLPFGPAPMRLEVRWPVPQATWQAQ